MNNQPLHTAPLPAAEAAFDAAAGSYDTDFSFSLTGSLQRKRVHYRLAPLLATLKNRSVLELNCGTGEDALWMAAAGCRVTATDGSANMAAALAEKRREQPQLNVEVLHCSYDKIPQQLGGRKFDFVLSNFGGLNCISAADMEQLAQALFHITTGDARLALVLMSPGCWWEKWYYLLKGKRQEAGRRKQQPPIMVSLGQHRLPVWYHHPAAVQKAFAAGFEKLYCRPVGILLPPSYMEGWFAGRKWLLRLLYGLEKLAGRFGFLSAYADHYLIVLKKKEG